MSRGRCAGVTGLVAATTVLVGCGGLSDTAATDLVRAYNRRITEAYRTGDARLVEGITGAKEATRLTALIGVKLDQGITLDSELTLLQPRGVDRVGDTIEVRTTETWRYVSRRIGTGAPVGEESVDHYEMVYVLKKGPQRWVVEEVRFASPPQVGRKEVLDVVPGAHP